MVADFRSEQVADIILECMADFIGIRIVTRPSFHTVWIGSSNSRVFLKRAAVAALSYRP
jgi:hypothetical protein